MSVWVRLTGSGRAVSVIAVNCAKAVNFFYSRTRPLAHAPTRTCTSVLPIACADVAGDFNSKPPHITHEDVHLDRRTVVHATAVRWCTHRRTALYAIITVRLVYGAVRRCSKVAARASEGAGKRAASIQPMYRRLTRKPQMYGDLRLCFSLPVLCAPQINHADLGLRAAVLLAAYSHFGMIRPRRPPLRRMDNVILVVFPRPLPSQGIVSMHCWLNLTYFAFRSSVYLN
jgi:hypothetical protein